MAIELIDAIVDKKGRTRERGTGKFLKSGQWFQIVGRGHKARLEPVVHPTIANLNDIKEKLELYNRNKKIGQLSRRVPIKELAERYGLSESYVNSIASHHRRFGEFA